MDWLRKFFIGTVDIPSPSDIIKSEGITYDEDNSVVVIELCKQNIGLELPPKVWLTTIQDTNSMDPTIDFAHTCILIAGANEEEQKKLVDRLTLGDIIVVKHPEGQVIHRIKKIGFDSKGRYFQTKGDNNYKADSYLSRDDDTKWLLIGVIY